MILLFIFLWAVFAGHPWVAIGVALHVLDEKF
jgi:hypothetical protein